MNHRWHNIVLRQRAENASEQVLKERNATCKYQGSTCVGNTIIAVRTTTRNAGLGGYEPTPGGQGFGHHQLQYHTKKGLMAVVLSSAANASQEVYTQDCNCIANSPRPVLKIVTSSIKFHFLEVSSQCL